LLHGLQEGDLLQRRPARSPPPGKSKHKDVRYLDIREDEVVDEAQLTDWLKQAAKQPGWMA
jgi:hypothetical protein